MPRDRTKLAERKESWPDTLRCVIEAAALIELLDAHAPWAPCALVPELSCWHTDDELPLWHALEERAGGAVGVPYFAIAWPSALVVARALLDGAVDVRGLRVADVGCGSGLVACAAMKAGAASALAIDVDPLAVVAADELARRHGVCVQARALDPLASPALAPGLVDVDVIVCADLVSREAQRAPFAEAVRAWRARGARVLLADSGRPFFDAQGLTLLLEQTVSATSRVDGSGARTVRLYADAAG
jgi:predicted nicotinamide N-methyase